MALPHQNIPLASTLISIALKMNKIPKFDFDFIAELEPYYLRKSQAEIMKEKVNLQTPSEASASEGNNF